ncbi:hypothetical protein SDC9_171319 [bioreactor metagenome]|uniref:Uncharacterized protein n=1 Tax=bioreactor metagenome TaxID=1076179 RepID=A0A645GCS0_9ZZZZ
MDNNGVIDELISYDGINLISSPDEVYSSELPDTYAKRDISVPLIITALILLLIDILLRRFPEVSDRIAESLYKLRKLVVKKKDNKSAHLSSMQNLSSKEEVNAEKSKKEKKITKESKEIKSSASTLVNIKRNRKK